MAHSVDSCANAEHCRVGVMGSGLNEGVWSKEPIRGIDDQVIGEYDFFQIGGSPFEVMFRSHLNGGGFSECEGN